MEFSILILIELMISFSSEMWKKLSMFVFNDQSYLRVPQKDIQENRERTQR